MTEMIALPPGWRVIASLRGPHGDYERQWPAVGVNGEGDVLTVVDSGKPRWTGELMYNGVTSWVLREPRTQTVVPAKGWTMIATGSDETWEEPVVAFVYEAPASAPGDFDNADYRVLVATAHGLDEFCWDGENPARKLVFDGSRPWHSEAAVAAHPSPPLTASERTT